MKVKFKAYIKSLNKIVDVKIIDFNKNVIYVNGERFSAELEWFLEDVILLQYTNVNDSINKEIYFGEI